MLFLDPDASRNGSYKITLVFVQNYSIISRVTVHLPHWSLDRRERVIESPVGHKSAWYGPGYLNTYEGLEWWGARNCHGSWFTTYLCHDLVGEVFKSSMEDLQYGCGLSGDPGIVMQVKWLEHQHPDWYPAIGTSCLCDVWLDFGRFSSKIDVALPLGCYQKYRYYSDNLSVRHR